MRLTPQAGEKQFRCQPGVEYREKNDRTPCGLEWNVEKYFLDGVECGEIPVEH